MKPVIIAIILTFFVACQNPSADNGSEAQSNESLDQAAINAGILSDPNTIQLEGRFESRNDIGTDKFCATKTENGHYNIGVLAVFGNDSLCEGQGIASLKGENLSVTLFGISRKDEGSCTFTASYDGVVIIFPGDIPQSCAKFCTNRASLSGTQYFQIESGNDAAKQLKGRAFNPLCKK